MWLVVSGDRELYELNELGEAASGMACGDTAHHSYGLAGGAVTTEDLL